MADVFETSNWFRNWHTQLEQDFAISEVQDIEKKVVGWLQGLVSVSDCPDSLYVLSKEDAKVLVGAYDIYEESYQLRSVEDEELLLGLLCIGYALFFQDDEINLETGWDKAVFEYLAWLVCQKYPYEQTIHQPNPFADLAQRLCNEPNGYLGLIITGYLFAKAVDHQEFTPTIPNT